MGFFQNIFGRLFDGASESPHQISDFDLSEMELADFEFELEAANCLDTQTTTPSSFDLLDEESVDSHLRIARYSDFTLTDAIRPSYDLQVIPCEAYRRDYFHDEQAGNRIPVLMISASAEKLFDLFLDLLELLGNQVDVVVETSHSGPDGGRGSSRREQIDLPVLQSILCDHEDAILNDGCLGIAVLNPSIPLEVQFDEHKLLVVYGNSLQPFEDILARYGIDCDEEVKFITEGEHVHASGQEYAEQFDSLRNHLGTEHSLDIHR
ncbi:MAG: hypothetical protein P8K78_05530 [Pirellulales bacterium]|nr:hypothetical protein [Pirellulales bacterium]